MLHGCSAHEAHWFSINLNETLPKQSSRTHLVEISSFYSSVLDLDLNCPLILGESHDTLRRMSRRMIHLGVWPCRFPSGRLRVVDNHNDLFLVILPADYFAAPPSRLDHEPIQMCRGACKLVRARSVPYELHRFDFGLHTTAVRSRVREVDYGKLFSRVEVAHIWSSYGTQYTS